MKNGKTGRWSREIENRKGCEMEIQYWKDRKIERQKVKRKRNRETKKERNTHRVR